MRTIGPTIQGESYPRGKPRRNRDRARRDTEGEIGQAVGWTEGERTTKRRIEITVNRERLLVLKRHVGAVSIWCGGCQQEVLMLTPDQAATIANISSRTVYRRVEAGEVHYTETAEGRLLVCANSMGMNMGSSADFMIENKKGETK